MQTKIVFFCLFHVTIKRFSTVWSRLLLCCCFSTHARCFGDFLCPLSPLARCERFSLQLSRLLDLSMQIICIPIVEQEFHFRRQPLCLVTARARMCPGRAAESPKLAFIAAEWFRLFQSKLCRLWVNHCYDVTSSALCNSCSDVFGFHCMASKRLAVEIISKDVHVHLRYMYMHRCERFPPDSPVNAALLRINFAVVNCCSAHSIWLLNDEKAQDLCVKDSRCGKNCSY